MSGFRRRLLLRSGAVLAAGLVLLLAYSALVVPRLVDERELRVELPRLPAAWEGQQVAVFSDLQVGMWAANLGTVERIVDRVIERRPAVVLVGGDLLYSSSPDAAAQTATVLELLTPLVDAGLPVAAVLGNHDHATGYADELTRRLEGAGIAVLRNDSLPVRLPGSAEPLHVVGIGSYRAGRDDPQRALRAVPEDAARVVLMHNPVSFLELPARSAPIAFAGHTHCGQLVLPVGDGLSRLDLRTDERYVIDGFAASRYGAAGNRLFVTCGIGFSRLPLRLGAQPQVVFATLVRGS